MREEDVSVSVCVCVSVCLSAWNRWLREAAAAVSRGDQLRHHCQQKKSQRRNDAKREHDITVF